MFWEDSGAETRKTSASRSTSASLSLSGVDPDARKNLPSPTLASDKRRSKTSDLDSVGSRSAGAKIAAASPTIRRNKIQFDRGTMGRAAAVLLIAGAGYTPITKHIMWGQKGTKLLPTRGVGAEFAPRFFGSTSKFAFAGRIRYGL